MSILSEAEPREVFKYFEEICAIPHGSGNTKKISGYCAAFAKSRSLSYIQDEYNNIIIFKDGTPGYENAAPVMLQGHLDMVCEKTPESAIDFENDGLSLILDNGVISARGTTLGGDDGIAVAMALALLASRDIPHPPLEVVLTVDEEIGMLGAAKLDCSPLKSRLMLNLDSEDEGVLLVSCAGGVTAVCRLPIERESVSGVAFKIKLSNLTGGHSGVEIDKGRANANRLMGRFLDALSKEASYSLISVNGGLKDNAIPRECEAVIAAFSDAGEKIAQIASKYEGIFASEYRATDPALSLKAEKRGEGNFTAASKISKKRMIAALVNLPSGIQRMSPDIPGLVQTSLNMGILKTSDAEMTMSFSVRSSVCTEKEELVSRLKNLMDILGGEVACEGEYPAWEYKPDSILRSVMTDVFKELYGREPKIEAIHAGVECGLFAGKLPGPDCVSMGPDMKNIHTLDESMDIASVKRTWDYLLAVLKRLGV